MKFIIKDEKQKEEKPAEVSIEYAGSEVNICINGKLVAYFTTHLKGEGDATLQVWRKTLKEDFNIDVDVDDIY